MAKRVILSSILDLFKLANENPALLSSVLMPIKNDYEHHKAEEAKCGTCGNKQQLVAHQRLLFEGVLVGLSAQGQATIKRALNVDELCYYYRDDKNMLNMRCF